MNPSYQYIARVIRIVDGDTVDLEVDLGFRVFNRIRTRLFGTNAPETYTQEGRLSKVWLECELPIGTHVTVQTFKDPTDKYGRWLATILKDGANINQLSVERGQAKLMP